MKTGFSIAVLISLALVAVVATGPVAAGLRTDIPDQAWQYRRLLVRMTLAETGSDETVSMNASLFYQEALWRNDLTSRVGARGPAQFMEGTAVWIIADFGRGLPCRTFDDFNDYGCAIPAAVRYLAVLRRGTKDTATSCDRWAMVLAKYNGGGIKADRQAAAVDGKDYGRWFDHTELYNGRNRSAGNFKENRGYPRKILLVHQPRFIDAGYGGRLICESHI